MRPESILLQISLSMLILMIVLAITEPEGVPLTDLKFLNNYTLSFYSSAFLAVAFVVTFWCWYSLYRAMNRRLLRL
jgi:hypothetical protein